MSSYRFRLFGVIPFGTHTIHIVRFDPGGISSRVEDGVCLALGEPVLLAQAEKMAQIAGGFEHG